MEVKNIKNLFAWTDTNQDMPNFVSVNQVNDKVVFIIRANAKSFQLNTPSNGKSYVSVIDTPNSVIEISVPLHDFLEKFKLQN